MISAQVLQNDVIVSGGGTAETTNMNIEFSIGEPIIETTETVDITLTQGFLQPSLTITSIEEDGMLAGISIYPNPVSDELTVQIPVQFTKALQWELLDMNGRILYQSEFFAGTQTIDMHQFAQGAYMLVITDSESGKQMNSKILKSR